MKILVQPVDAAAAGPPTPSSPRPNWWFPLALFLVSLAVVVLKWSDVVRKTEDGGYALPYQAKKQSETFG